MQDLNESQVKQVMHIVEAINELDQIIKFYSADVPGPAYLTCRFFEGGTRNLQMKCPIFLYALDSQREAYLVSLWELGINYTKEA